MTRALRGLTASCLFGEAARGEWVTSLCVGLATTGVAASQLCAGTRRQCRPGEQVIQAVPHTTRMCTAQVPYPVPLGKRIARLQTVRGSPQYLLTNATPAAP
jgi:hypothetical protein